MYGMQFMRHTSSRLGRKYSYLLFNSGEGELKS